MYRLIALCSVLFLLSCTKEIDNDSTTPYQFTYPSYFPELYDSDLNPTTNQGVELGRHLYYDSILSSNGRSCSSCHNRESSFSVSIFELNGVTTSVPPHINLAWNPNYNWNGSEEILDVLCIGDFGQDFFNTNMDSLRERFKNHDYYPEMFDATFGVSIADEDDNKIQLYVSYAVSQFMRSIISSNSKYDQYLAGDYQFTDDESNGYTLFNSARTACFHCHGGALFTDNKFHNNGLDIDHQGVHQGRYLVSGDQSDIGKFSTPTLRNVELTAPYMHDGRFSTLEEVIAHYNTQIIPSPTLAIELEPHVLGIELSDQEQSQLIAFLKTLTDYSLLENENYENPHFVQ